MSQQGCRDREELKERLAALIKDPSVKKQFRASQDKARRLSKLLRDADRVDPEILRQPVTM